MFIFKFNFFFGNAIISYNSEKSFKKLLYASFGTFDGKNLPYTTLLKINGEI